MLKTLLILSGALVFCATGLQAQSSHTAAAARGPGSVGLSAARPSAYHGFGHGGYAYTNRFHRHGNWGHYYYLGGIPYFYPFGFGFGYPYGYGGFYGGFGDGYGYGGAPYGNAAAGPEGGANGDNQGEQRGSGASLPEAVQRQLAKRGYYKGSVDGEFGPASRDALSRFQKKQGLKETGKIDEPTLEALGFTDRR